MIKIEKITIRSREFERTYSDAGYYIQAESGAIYSEAVDPVGSGRTYTETETLIEGENDE